jgi:hypothetical protein
VVTRGRTVAPTVCRRYEHSNITIAGTAPVSITAVTISGNTPGTRVDAHSAGGASSGRRQRVGSIGHRPPTRSKVTSWRMA